MSACAKGRAEDTPAVQRKCRDKVEQGDHDIDCGMNRVMPRIASPLRDRRPQPGSDLGEIPGGQ